MNPYLCAAYVATWVIHITYFAILARRYSRLQREIEKLKPPDPKPNP
ncbi:MAG TPA: CcmD family protein [Terriglobales bacterium]|nr:CcmD family protein [Terriglobales bacterium]